MIEAERLIKASPIQDDTVFDRAIRPLTLDEYIGQPAAREQMEIFIQAARGRKEALDHVLIYGPPGLGKTTLANIIANEMQAAFQSTAAPALQIKGDLTAVLTNLQNKQV